MLDEVIKNEVADALGYQPTPEELTMFRDYINDYMIERENAGELNKVFFTNIGLIIEQCKKENYKKCEVCGEMYRMDDEDAWNPEKGWVCRDCEPYQDWDEWADFQNDLAKGE